MTHFTPCSSLSVFIILYSFLIALLAPEAYSLAVGAPLNDIERRTDTPNFPDQPPSCPLCATNYWSINSCAEAAPVLANFTSVIFNPGAFISVIECACTDTFQSAYPQCVDCFTQTGQTSFLNASSPDIPGILTGIRNVCALESVLLGGVATADGEVTPTSSGAIPVHTDAATSGEVSVHLWLGFSLTNRVLEGVVLAICFGTGLPLV